MTGIPARLPGEPVNGEIGRVNLEQERGLPRNGVLVIGKARPVRGPHLYQPGAALRHDVGDPERSADLDELPAADDHFPPPGVGRETEQYGGGVVVDDVGALGAGQGAQHPLDVREAG
jgi:hypothetical protein